METSFPMFVEGVAIVAIGISVTGWCVLQVYQAWRDR